MELVFPARPLGSETVPAKEESAAAWKRSSALARDLGIACRKVRHYGLSTCPAQGCSFLQ